MTGITISNQGVGGSLGRLAAALVLVAVGVGAGIGIVELGGLAGSGSQPAAAAVHQLGSDASWQAFRAGERQEAVGLDRDTGYQRFRAGERTLEAPSLNAGYVEFRAGERQPNP